MLDARAVGFGTATTPAVSPFTIDLGIAGVEGRLQILVVGSLKDQSPWFDPQAPSVSGGWTQIHTSLANMPAFAYRQTIWRRSTTGATILTFTERHAISWACVEFTGTTDPTPNGAGAIQQMVAKLSTDDPMEIQMAAFASTSNGAFGVAVDWRADFAYSPGADYEETTPRTTYAPNGITDQFQISTETEFLPQPTTTIQWTTPPGIRFNYHMIVGFEIKAPVPSDIWGDIWGWAELPEPAH